MNQPIATVTNNTATPAQRGSWLRFHRFNGNTNFYGVVTKEGEWVDSSVTMPGALFNASQHAGISNDYETLDALMPVLQELGYSIIHDSVLEMMYISGVLK